MSLTRDDIAAITRGMAEPTRDLIARTVQPLVDKIEQQERVISRNQKRMADMADRLTEIEELLTNPRRT